jgi:ribosomal 50S subunit-recycling heat shock protein
MRLDAFLKISRLVKRRTVANALCDEGRVLLNGAIARASHAVKPSDILDIHDENGVRRVRVLAIPETQQTKAQAARLFELISQEPVKLLDLRRRDDPKSERAQ